MQLCDFGFAPLVLRLWFCGFSFATLVLWRFWFFDLGFAFLVLRLWFATLVCVFYFAALVCDFVFATLVSLLNLATTPCLPMKVGLLDLNGKDGGLRLRAANMLGLLIRHASSISASLVDAGELAPAARDCHKICCAYLAFLCREQRDL